MGQGIGRVPEAPAVDAARAGREPIGRYLAQQRRLRGIELEELAARTRIPRRSLERLEAGAFDRSPDGFSRGFVRTVAEAIGVDPDDAVARMLPEPDGARTRPPRARRALGAVAAVVALAGLALGANEIASRILAGGAATARPDLPVRHDYVRALAEQHGIRVAALGPEDAQLAPLPPAPAVADAAVAGAGVAAGEGGPESAGPVVEPPAAAPAGPQGVPSPTPGSPAPAPVASDANSAPPGTVARKPEAPPSPPAPAPPARAASQERAPSQAPRVEQARGEAAPASRSAGAVLPADPPAAEAEPGAAEAAPAAGSVPAATDAEADD